MMRLWFIAAIALGCGHNSAPPSNVALPFQENFAAADAAPWPSPWHVLGGVATATVLGGRGRLTPNANGYSLARMGVTAAHRDFEVTFQLRFEDVGTQGIGFYVRQNGGYLTSATHGAGYAIFVEGFRGSQVGVWREVDGGEAEIQISPFSPSLMSNLTYAARFRVTQAQAGGPTRLQARLWAATQTEPSSWQIDATDPTPSLQDALGGFAVDSYSSVSSGTIAAGTLVGNIVVTGL
jgi:hypothetical protein